MGKARGSGTPMAIATGYDITLDATADAGVVISAILYIVYETITEAQTTTKAWRRLLLLRQNNQHRLAQ